MANVIGQIYFIDVFLGGEFLQYGTEVLKFHLFKDPQGMYFSLIFLLSEGSYKDLYEASFESVVSD